MPVNRKSFILFFLLIIFLLNLSAKTGRIYGVVRTGDGEIFEGWIRWDKHETFWDDYLDGTKKHYLNSQLDDDLVLKIYGPYKVYRDEKDFRTNSTSAIQFGHISKIIKDSETETRVQFKDGRQLLLRNSGTDIGPSNRGIEIDDLNFGKVTFNWKEFESVEFQPEPSDYLKQKGADQTYRLFGIIKTRSGNIFKGYFFWDNDECLSTDILNGKYRRREMEIPFSQIRTIRRDSKTTSWLELENGKKITLSGSNDVDSGNRGILIKDPGIGELMIPWDDFDEVVIKHRIEKNLKDYNDFDGGHPLLGEVYTRDGFKKKGYICWDNDEMFSSDVLDGKFEKFDVNVEFGQIHSIEQNSRHSALVEIRDGEIIKLSGTNDVNSSNLGIWVMTRDGQYDVIRWDDFQKIIFSK